MFMKEVGFTWVETGEANFFGVRGVGYALGRKKTSL
jgi:hypothetical protein